MCNACGFLCCGSDEFSGCGCDHCDEPDCHSELCFNCGNPLCNGDCEDPYDDIDDDHYDTDRDRARDVHGLT